MNELDQLRADADKLGRWFDRYGAKQDSDIAAAAEAFDQPDVDMRVAGLNLQRVAQRALRQPLPGIGWYDQARQRAMKKYLSAGREYVRSVLAGGEFNRANQILSEGAEGTRLTARRCRVAVARAEELQARLEP